MDENANPSRCSELRRQHLIRCGLVGLRRDEAPDAGFAVWRVNDGVGVATRAGRDASPPHLLST